MKATAVSISNVISKGNLWKKALRKFMEFPFCCNSSAIEVPGKTGTDPDAGNSCQGFPCMSMRKNHSEFSTFCARKPYIRIFWGYSSQFALPAEPCNLAGADKLVIKTAPPLRWGALPRGGVAPWFFSSREFSINPRFLSINKTIKLDGTPETKKPQKNSWHHKNKSLGLEQAIKKITAFKSSSFPRSIFRRSNTDEMCKKRK